MTDLYYTEAFDNLDSELVFDVFYDEKNQEAHVNLHDTIYTYYHVPRDAVRSLVNANSIGREFNGNFFTTGFKRKFGPGTKHGFVDSVVFRKRELATTGVASETVGTPGASTTTTFPGVVPKALVDKTGTNTGKTVPLKPADETRNEPVELPKGTYTVHFESDYSGSKTYTVESTSVDAAVAELKDVTDRLGLRVTVTGVFVHLA